MALLRKLVGYKTKPNTHDIKDIIDNLNIILNTKRGYGFFLQDFGLSDHHHLRSKEDIAKVMVCEIKENIARFEPRIELLSIEAIEDEQKLHLSFLIDFIVQKSQYSLRLQTDTTRNHYHIES